MTKKREYTPEEMILWDRALEMLDAFSDTMDRIARESEARIGRLEAMLQAGRLEAMTSIDAEANIDRSPLPYWSASKLEAR